MSGLDKIRAEALSLSQRERAELAHALLSSLDGFPDADAAQAWEAEILSRLDQLDAGTAETVSREEFS
jgi:putative addiction module component (TIGR02574 family)